jgi:hypothetical protein
MSLVGRSKVCRLELGMDNYIKRCGRKYNMNCPTKEQVLNTVKKAKRKEVVDTLKGLFPDIFEESEEVQEGQFFYYDYDSEDESPNTNSFLLVKDKRLGALGRYLMVDIFHGLLIGTFQLRGDEKITLSLLSSAALNKGCYNLRHPIVKRGERSPVKIVGFRFKSIYKGADKK